MIGIFTNIGTSSLYRMANSEGGVPGYIETIFDLSPEEFAFDDAGNAYIATDTANTIIKVAPNGVTEVVADVQQGTCPVLIDYVLYRACWLEQLSKSICRVDLDAIHTETGLLQESRNSHILPNIQGNVGIDKNQSKLYFSRIIQSDAIFYHAGLQRSLPSLVNSLPADLKM